MFVIAWIGLILCLSTVPPTSRDALTHHLRVPQLYVDHGGIVELPEIEFSYYPMNLDLLYLLPLIWGNDIVPKYIHFAFALLTAGVIFLFLKQRLGTPYACFGAIFFLTLPLIVKLSITVYVDLGLAFFFTAAIISLLHWAENQYPLKYLVLAGFFCGLALGTKYNSLIGFVLLTGAVPFLVAGQTQAADPATTGHEGRGIPSALTATLIFVAVALLAFSPWMIRNLIWTGNPLYPLFNTVFNGQAAGAQTPLTPFAVRQLVYGEPFWQIILVPLRIFFSGQDNNPQLFDGRLSPFLLLLPLIALYGLRQDSEKIRREKLLLGFFSCVTILIVFFKQDMRVRYLVAAVPPLVILSTMGLHRAAETLSGKLSAREASTKRAVALAAVVVIGLNLPYLHTLWRSVDPISYLSGELSRDDYIEKHRPEYALFRFAQAEISKDAKIQGLFLGNRGYYCKQDIVFDIPGFQRRLEASEDANDLYESLRQAGITHLMINERLFVQWSQSNLDGDAQRVLGSFLESHTRSLLGTDKGFHLLALHATHS